MLCLVQFSPLFLKHTSPVLQEGVSFPYRSGCLCGRRGATLGDGELKDHERDPELLAGNLVTFLWDVGLRPLPLKGELKLVVASNVSGLTTALSYR